MTNLDSILKSRDITLPTKVHLVKAMFFSTSHVWMWELDHKEGREPKNWCFWILVLEKTLESPSDCKEIQPVHPKGDQSWVFTGRTDVEAETPILWPSHPTIWLLGKILMLGGIGGRRRSGRQRTRPLDGITNSMDMGLGQGGLVCCGSCSIVKRHDWVTELNWIDINMIEMLLFLFST